MVELGGNMRNCTVQTKRGCFWCEAERTVPTLFTGQLRTEVN
jgi:hypothetical protein